MFCLDTNIVIFALNKRKPWIATRLENELRAGTALIVPAIVLFELDYGIAKSDRAEQARALLKGFLSAGIGQPAFDAEDARETADIRAFLERQGTPIGPFDYLVAAQARRRDAGDAQSPRVRARAGAAGDGLGGMTIGVRKLASRRGAARSSAAGRAGRKREQALHTACTRRLLYI